ncbi:type II toxin-antitoxin system RelB/DinJ family antitoxin [Enterococcus durans]|uniref:type II toxin-antitoxin system RelB/DinJ family antitoxin n=1 Tax=Enterococcus durans TaxID=53345 RepID=UPI001C0190CC|nr:type II toxin-antitoxin system RelB/DinJ family antitoxin [Enterococcus durans]MBT9718238.1 type II toxin-antitoxin system RelB/DinJ family antitoxin [Enterococcus durans]
MTKLLQLRIDENLKNDADNLFKKLGLTTNDAIKIFLSQSVIEQKIPFEIKLEPNSDTVSKIMEKLEELIEDKDPEFYKNSNDLFKDLGI